MVYYLREKQPSPAERAAANIEISSRWFLGLLLHRSMNKPESQTNYKYILSASRPTKKLCEVKDATARRRF